MATTPVVLIPAVMDQTVPIILNMVAITRGAGASPMKPDRVAPTSAMITKAAGATVSAMATMRFSIRPAVWSYAARPKAMTTENSDVLSFAVRQMFVTAGIA